MGHTLRTLFAVAILFVSMETMSSRIVRDLTHTFDDKATKWPMSGFKIDMPYYFKMDQLVAKDYGDFWLSFNFLEFYEHQGTHMDAPSHFGRGRWASHEIPPERLVGPGVVIDIREKAEKNPDYAVSVEDIQEYEKKFGTIPSNAIIMMNSGWGRHYPNAEKVFGSVSLNDSKTFHFPGWSLGACKMLLRDRQVSVVGVDTPSTDIGQSRKFECHTHLQTNDVPLLEYVANLDTIPEKGTTIVLGSMKTRGGTGGPTRILAILDEEKDHQYSNAGTSNRKLAYMAPLSVLLAFCLTFILHV